MSIENTRTETSFAIPDMFFGIPENQRSVISRFIRQREFDRGFNTDTPRMNSAKSKKIIQQLGDTYNATSVHQSWVFKKMEAQKVYALGTIPELMRRGKKIIGVLDVCNLRDANNIDHDTGDRLLKLVVIFINSVGCDAVRFGGDELVIMGSNDTKIEEVINYVNRMKFRCLYKNKNTIQLLPVKVKRKKITNEMILNSLYLNGNISAKKQVRKLIALYPELINSLGHAQTHFIKPELLSLLESILYDPLLQNKTEEINAKLGKEFVCTYPHFRDFSRETITSAADPDASVVFVAMRYPGLPKHTNEDCFGYDGTNEMLKKLFEETIQLFKAAGVESVVATRRGVDIGYSLKMNKEKAPEIIETIKNEIEKKEKTLECHCREGIHKIEIRKSKHSEHAVRGKPVDYYRFNLVSVATFKTFDDVVKKSLRKKRNEQEKNSFIGKIVHDADRAVEKNAISNFKQRLAVCSETSVFDENLATYFSWYLNPNRRRTGKRLVELFNLKEQETGKVIKKLRSFYREGIVHSRRVAERQIIFNTQLRLSYFKFIMELWNTRRPYILKTHD